MAALQISCKEACAAQAAKVAVLLVECVVNLPGTGVDWDWYLPMVEEVTLLPKEEDWKESDKK